MIPGLPTDIALLLIGTESEDVNRQLTAAERQRMRTFGHPDRRRAFALGRAAARTLLSERLGVSPLDVPLHVAQDGAPDLLGTALNVTITHAGRGDEILAAAAIGDRPLGIDLEAIVPRRSDLHERILQPAERAAFEALPYDANTSQLLMWSMKEAVLKGLRTGFRRPARSIYLSSIQDGRAVASLPDGPSWAVRYARHGDFWLCLAFLE